MATLIILLAQTKAEATIALLLLLLLAAIIGYLTSWLYFRSVYSKRIKLLEHERHEFNNHIINLNAEVSELHKSLGEKNLDLEYLKMDINALKALNKKALNKTNDMEQRTIKAEKLLHKKDDALTRLLHGNYLLDYNNFGFATKDEKDDLQMISGIGPLIEGRLNALHIFTFRQISQFTAHDIQTINDAIIYFSGRIEKDEWVAQARELLNVEAMRQEILEKIRDRKTLINYSRIGTASIDEADDLTAISGIGGWIKEKLNALDIYTFKQISNLTEPDVQTLAVAIDYFSGRIERDEWIIQAADLLRKAGKKSELLKSIEAMKERIYFDRLGVASLHQANNLTRINGIGIWSEERLNSLGIFTFEQISKLTPSDAEIIAEILNIAPDRIDQLQWVNQARKLTNRDSLTTSFTKN